MMVNGESRIGFGIWNLEFGIWNLEFGSLKPLEIEWVFFLGIDTKRPR